MSRPAIASGAAPARRARSRSAARTISTSRARSRWRSRARTTRSRSTASTQHPSEIQHMVAIVLGVPNNAVTVECRRMGGGFGGKETQGNLFACVAALVAKKTGRAAKIRPDRDDDMVITGKRHDFVVDYDVGFDDEGRIQGVDMTYAARCGFSADLSGPVTDRALFHADNCYYLRPRRACARCRSRPTRSRTPPFAASAARRAWSRASADRGDRLRAGQGPARDPQAQFLWRPTSATSRPTTRRSRTTSSSEIVAELERSADYRGRRAAIRECNAHEPRDQARASR